MLRVAVFGILALAFACHRKSDAGDTDNGGAAGGSALVASAAGVVRELAGTVTVAGKPLTVGDRVAAGDVVTTGDRSRVMIELIHNGAKWELGPNRAVRVADSIAWKLSPDQAATGAVIRDMAQPNVTPGATATSPASPPQAATPQGAAAVLMVHRAALMHCLTSASTRVQLLVHVDSSGSAKTETPGAPEDIRACLTAEVDKLTFPPQEAGVGITLEK